MSYPITQFSAEPLVFLLVSNVDHITGVPGLAPTVTIRKAGGAFAVPAGAISEVGNGWYQVAGNILDSDTAGPLLLHATAPGCDPTDPVYEITPFLATPGAPVLPDITELMMSPKRTRTAEGTVEERSVADLIAADRFANPAPEAVPWGIRIAKTKPPSTCS